jgi:hypothetical protein
MTMPDERTRSLRWVGEFLRECRERELPEDLARQIDEILQDYPTSEDIAYLAENIGKMDFGA